jgi:ATPase subunit of ABC transporter with duplicated ATPase domains
MSVVEQVLAADTERSTLMEEEKVLSDEIEAATIAEDSYDESSMKDDAWWLETQTRLGKISESLESCGADAADARVRVILTGLGFTDEMMDGPSTVCV